MEDNKTFSTPLVNEYKTYSMDLAGRKLSVDIGRVGKQANGCAFMHYGDTTLLCTATASDKPREGIDFFPAVCESMKRKCMQWERFPAASIKEKERPGEHATLTSRGN